MGEVEGFVIPASERESPLKNCCFGYAKAEEMRQD